MRNKLFGTDGIRGKYGTFPLDRKSLIRYGRVLSILFKGREVVTGRDTRESGKDIESLLLQGAGLSAEYVSAGVVPTPGLSFLTRECGFDHGIMITASHNPFTDNGIKFFNSSGEKMSEEFEREFEELFFSDMTDADSETVPDIREDLSLIKKYKDFIVNSTGVSEGKRYRIIADSSNGAFSGIAYDIFKSCGFDVYEINCNPDGKNINFKCGSTHPESLIKEVQERGADIGVAFDGDGDRVLLCDIKGRIISGDHSLFLIAKYFRSVNKKFNSTAVGTVMSNLGLKKALKEIGVKLFRSDVGDKHVYEMMKKEGSMVGGEPSGHTILTEFQRSGDGILTALMILEAAACSDLAPEDIYDSLTLVPQGNSALRVREKIPLKEWSELNDMIHEFEKKYKDDARVLVRYSGTEPKIRIMVEANDEKVVSENIKRFEGLIKARIGA